MRKEKRLLSNNQYNLIRSLIGPAFPFARSAVKPKTARYHRAVRFVGGMGPDSNCESPDLSVYKPISSPISLNFVLFLVVISTHREWFLKPMSPSGIFMDDSLPKNQVKLVIDVLVFPESQSQVLVQSRNACVTRQFSEKIHPKDSCRIYLIKVILMLNWLILW